MTGGRASRQKGDRFERELVRLFQEEGFAAERIPLSGSVGGSFCGDLTVPIMGRDRRIECKKRGRGFGSLYDWLSDHWALIVGCDRRAPLVVMRLDQFLWLAQAASQSQPAQGGTSGAFSEGWTAGP